MPPAVIRVGDRRQQRLMQLEAVARDVVFLADQLLNAPERLHGVYTEAIRERAGELRGLLDTWDLP